MPPPEPIKLSDDPRPTLGPDTFVSTMKAGERYQAIAEGGGWSSVPSEITRLKTGDDGPAIVALRRRLALTGDLPQQEASGSQFDDALRAGIRRFQARHGLEETGLVGPRTLVHLNISASQRVRQLQASATRLMGSKFAFGDRYVAVNIPSAAVEAVDRGVVARRYVAVIGRRERASPQVETRITSVNFNPTWTAPVSIIKKDIIPHVRKDPAYLAKMRIRLFDAQGQEVDPNTIDWSTNQAANYTVRQDAGADNSLGEIRIDMPNRHAVYMHDTPSKRLFARSMRAQSSGCVRVSGVKDLAAWLLETSPGPAGQGWSGIDIETAIAGGRRVDAKLSKPVPVAWVYMTGYGMADGSVHFRDDVYGLDEPPPLPEPKPAAIAAARAADPVVTSSITPARR
ncbi:L,D-transpeptidase family protein [Enterovirga rhinocerotis]|uniref:L,D-transpeptidase family protein n=1 Tax=Enterovirga rhinocerotis TaxID=1339210 RepID=UPI001FDEFE67|nr:L,D-transpeptidase family protein [Enterovirga rhinocerotis]